MTAGNDDVYVFPTSYAQQRLWFADQLGAGTAYTIAHAGAFRLDGPLEVEALERALEEIVRRHETLRTTFSSVDGEPMQVIDPSARVAITRRNLADLPPGKRLAEAKRLASTEAERPFDLATGPLFRPVLLRLDETDHVLLLFMHHIVSDGWSMGVLYRELSTLYAAFRLSLDSPLPDLAIQYADFAVWQREWLQGKALGEQLEYWRERFPDTPPLLHLPTSSTRPPTGPFHAARQPLEVPEETVDALAALSRRSGTTLFMTLLTGFFALLSRYSNEDDVVLGTPVANRNRAEIEGLIGFFVNTLPLRLDLSGDPTFRDLLASAREVSLGAYAHQDLPFEKLVAELDPERDVSRNPLYQVVFALQDFSVPGLALEGLETTRLEFDFETVRFDLECHLRSVEGRLQGHFLFATELFDKALVARMADNFLVLLRGVAADPARRISELPLLTATERHTVIEDWNTTSAQYPAKRCVHELVEEQARRRPEATAVVAGDRSISYAEVNRRANQLAHNLIDTGVIRGSRVAVCIERSPEMIVAALAALKAGCAYVPLDPAHPHQRLELMIVSAASPVLLTQASIWERFTSPDVRPILLDTDWPAIGCHSQENPDLTSASSDLAYVVFTSGSTGEPKGVEVEHRSLLNLVSWHQKAFGLRPEDRTTQIAGLSFDASVWEIWSSLASGAALHIPDQRQRLSAEALRDWLVAQKVTVTFLPTVLAEAVLTLPWPRETAIRTLLTGGDRLRIRPPASLPFTVVNNYGPSEATVVTTSGQVRVQGPSHRSPSIGRPISNCRVYILDRFRQPVPLGVIGELYVAGDSIARGYLNDPTLTAQKYLRDPFSDDPVALMFRTGDMGRYRHDGAIEYVGRGDDQLKIRGVRVEPGEIEASLKAHEMVRDAVVVTHANASGEMGLVAYVAPRRGHSTPQRAADDQKADFVQRWRDLYDEIYGRAPTDPDPTSNAVGWNSSYTGEPISWSEMREWIDSAVGQIRRLNPRRVLEIGCGTGLLLSRIAPLCQSYVATDFSAVALGYVRANLDRSGLSTAQVTLMEKEACDFEGIPKASFDLVILNSVVQYFPDQDYLVKVLSGAVEAVAAPGFVFVGDVRSLPMLRSFHTSVEFFNAPPDRTVSWLDGRVRDRMEREKELVIDPALFEVLPQQCPGIRHAEIRHKPGRSLNELTKYRYDVLLSVGSQLRAAPPVDWLTWKEIGCCWAGIEAAMNQSRRGLVAISGIPNRRLADDRQLLRELEACRGDGLLGDLTIQLTAGADAGLEPDDLELWSREAGFAVELLLSADGADGDMDAVFWQPGGHHQASPAVPRPGSRSPVDRQEIQSCYTNKPSTSGDDGALVSHLRQFLRNRLPAPMIPADFVILESLPVLASGKIDKRALPAPQSHPDEPSESYLAPRDDLEKQLVQLWEKVLNSSPIGVRDDFFDAGGHSLLGARLVWEIKHALKIKLPLEALFRFSTVEAMAESMRQPASSQRTEVVPGVASTPHLSDDEHQRMAAVLASGRHRPLRLGSLITGFNLNGSRRPLFWCFNVPSLEPQRLVDQLGPDQPLYALFTGVRVLSWQAGTAETLARHYTDEILGLQVADPYWLGGNCAGGWVATGIALRLLEMGYEVERLCLLESFDRHLFDYPAPMSLLYGKESHLRLHEKFRWGEPGWEGAFRSVPEVHWVPGAHGEFFEPPNVGTLGKRVAELLKSDKEPTEQWASAARTHSWRRSGSPQPGPQSSPEKTP